MVEDFGAQEPACGVTRPGMFAAVRAGFRYNRIQEIADTDSNVETPILYVSGDVHQLASGWCAGTFRLAIHTIQGYYAPWDAKNHIVSVEYCHMGQTLVFQPVDYATELHEGLRTGLDQCLSEIADRTL